MEQAESRKRQATSGTFQPYPEYKESGVGWLGDVPSNWMTGPFKRGSTLQAGFAFQSATFSKSEGLPIVRMNNITGKGVLDLTDAAKVPEQTARREFLLNDGDLVMGMSGSIESIARVSKGDLPCALNQRVGRFQLKEFRAEFLALFPLRVVDYFHPAR